MFRIISWLTATLAVLALITYYQVNLTGEEEHAQGATAAADCGGDRPPTTANQAAEADAPAGTSPEADAPAGAAPDAPAGEDKADDPCANSEHSGKPGESK